MSSPAVLTAIIPASNEARLIPACLGALLNSDWTRAAPVQVVVVANGCSDDTAQVARGFEPQAQARGWDLQVIERAQGGKIGALNAGDAAARGAMRAYLDADVTLSPDLLQQLADLLDQPGARYASGRVMITAKGWVSRGYARIWQQVPFMSACVPGCGLFAVNETGRARWGVFPDVVSDDTFVRLCFTPAERLQIAASYDWPIAEGLAALIRVRRRQDAGVDEIAQQFPELLTNDDKPSFALRDKLRLALRAPLGFVIYCTVALASKLTRHRAQGWSRSR